jgi:hypothetical protein
MGTRFSKVPSQNTPVEAFNTDELYNEIKPLREPRHATHVESEIDYCPPKNPESTSQDTYSVISNDLYRSLYAPEVKTVHGTEISS